MCPLPPTILHPDDPDVLSREVWELEAALVIDSSEPPDRPNRLDVALDPDGPDELLMVDMLGPDDAASRFRTTVDGTDWRDEGEGIDD
jgi:hypothetical protein